MEFRNRREVSSLLKTFCPGCSDDQYISICEWSNGDGWDIDINGKSIALSYDELEAINFLTRALQYEDEVKLDNEC